jgi:hypothetical protein
MATMLEVRRFIRHLTGAIVVFLKFLIEIDDHLQVRLRQRHLFFHSKRMSSCYHVLNLD